MLGGFLVLVGALFNQTARLDARIDDQTARIDDQTARIDHQTARIDSLAARTEVQMGGVREAIDRQGTELRRAIDAQGTELRRAIDAQGAQLRQAIDNQTVRIDALNARIDAHLEDHTRSA